MTILAKSAGTQNIHIVLGILLAFLWMFGFESLDGADWAVGRGNPSSTAVAPGSLPEKPEVLWEFKTESDKSGFEATPVIADGKVFIGDFDGAMHAIDLQSGKEIWSKKTKDGFLTSAAVHQNKVVIGDFGGQVFCFDTASGKEIWSREIDQQVASGGNFFGEDILLTSESGSMHALNLVTGEPKWSYATGDQLKSSPTIWKTFSLLGGCDGRLHKVDLVAGKSVGDGFALGGPTLSTPSVVGNLAIVPTQPGVVLAIDVETEKEVWNFSDQAIASDIRSSPASLGKIEGDAVTGIAVITTRNRRVVGLDLKSGKLLWESVLKKRTDGSPVICDGRAWVCSADGMVYAFDLLTGAEKWSYQLAGQIIASPAIADGRLIIATEKGSLFCFGKK
jgi:outer membrane protein assembly factor BamB